MIAATQERLSSQRSLRCEWFVLRLALRLVFAVV